MERVQYHQEQMLPELKDFLKKGIFTNAEVKEIVKKRTAFEMALVRRVADKADFLRYAAYEMGLEALRKKRVERLKLPPSQPSISDYALVRRQYYIFERAVRKFKADVALWMQYIEVARRNGAKALVGRICARALQLHPTTPPLYILASQHELSQHSPTAARALLQRGLRLNRESVELWTEYVKMELGFVESIRRRWDVLGISGKGEDTEGAEDVSGSDQAARNEVMNGAIVKAVIDSAVKALPTLPLFRSLSHLLSTYPTALAPSLLSHLDHHLLRCLPSDPQALLLHATRSLSSDTSEVTSVDKLEQANEELTGYVKTLGGEMGVVYGKWVSEWAERLEKEEFNLVQYLVLSLHALTSALSRSHLTPELCLTHVRLVARYKGQIPVKLTDPAKLAKKYTARFPADADLWLERISMSTEDQGQVVKEARERCSDVRVWEWEVDRHSGEELDDDSLRGLYEPLLRDALPHPEIHTSLLLRYLTLLPLTSLLSVLGRHPPHPQLFAQLFAHLSRSHHPSSPRASRQRSTEMRHVLSVLYDRWRIVPGEEAPAALAWAEWLTRNGEGGVAMTVIGRARGVEGLEDGWRNVLARFDGGGPRGSDGREAEMQVTAI